MLDKSGCVHIPPLYEEGTAKIMWESVDDADGYELDMHFDEDFEAASHGKQWSDVDISNADWETLQNTDMTWEEFQNLPAQGRSWRSWEFENASWQEFEEKALSWAAIQKMPVKFTVYRGPGEKIQGPDQGLAWQNVDSDAKTWAELEAKYSSWEDFMFQPSVGPSLDWAAVESKQKTWQEISDADFTWKSFEEQLVRGKNWDSLNSEYADWASIEAKGMSWREFENQTADNKTHIAHTVEIPLYKKQAILRVRAYKGDEYSDYLTTTLKDIIPLFYRDGNISFSAVQGQKYEILLCAHGVNSLTGVNITLEYNAAQLVFNGFLSNTATGQKKAAIIPANITEISRSNGKIVFTCSRAVSVSKLTSHITRFAFTAAQTGNVTIKIY